MNAAFPILTTASILIHSVLGCCWHHSHRCEVVHAEVPAADNDVHGHEGCVHHQHQSTVSAESTKDEVPDGNHSGHEDCDDTDCWMFSVTRPDFTFQLTVTTALVGQHDATSLSRTSFLADSFFAPRQKPKEPRRAMTQTWLL
jgi:hypothetical protein